MICCLVCSCVLSRSPFVGEIRMTNSFSNENVSVENVEQIGCCCVCVRLSYLYMELEHQATNCNVDNSQQIVLHCIACLCCGYLYTYLIRWCLRNLQNSTSLKEWIDAKKNPCSLGLLRHYSIQFDMIYSLVVTILPNNNALI